MNPASLVALLGALFAVVYFVIPLLVKGVLRRQLRRDMSAAGSVALTFDDGPDPDCTPRVLDALLSSGIRASFFVQGEKASLYPELIQRMQREGHDVGEHGFRHLHAWTALPHLYLRDLLLSQRAVERASRGGRIRFMRPAYGKLNVITLFYSLLFRKQLVFWTVDPRDYETRGVEDTVSRILVGLGSAQSGVVLLHDGRPAGSHAESEATVLVVRLLCSRLRESNARFRSLGELAAQGDAQVPCIGS